MSESTPGAIGMRTGVADRQELVRQPGPFRPDHDRLAAGRRDVRDVDRRRSPASARTACDPRRLRAARRASRRVRAWGSVNAVPIATRRARRASGSALVWSSSSPSHPNAAALRTIAPTLAGLSTPSTITSRSAAREQIVRRTGAAAGGTGPRSSCGMPRPVTSRRTSLAADVHVGAGGDAGARRRAGCVAVGEPERTARSRRRGRARRPGRPRPGTARRRRRHACRRGWRARAR